MKNENLLRTRGRARWLITLIALLTLGVGQMWGDWTGNAGICVNGTWYKASSDIDKGNWLEEKTTINGTDLGAISSLSLGGEYQNYAGGGDDECSWNSGNSGIYITITTNSGTQIDAFKLSCYHDGKSGSNNVWKTTGSTGECGDGSAWAASSVDISDYEAGIYKLKVHWYSASSVALPSSGDDVATFTIDPKVTFSVSPAGAADDPTNNQSISSGDAVTSGTTVEFTHSDANDGYQWSHWENGSGANIGTSSTYTASSISAHTTVVAVYTEKNYTVSVVSSSATAGYVASSSVTGHVSTSANLPNATANTGYYFVNWEVTSGTATITNSNSATTATINGMTEDVTVRANFAPIWRILGSEASNTSTGTDGFGGWDVDNDFAAITHIGTNASSKDTGYVELTLEANKNYEFKLFKHNATGDARYYGNGGDKVYYMTYAGSHTNWEFATDKSKNCGITTAGAGTYKFAWNLTDNTLSVYYPSSVTITLDLNYSDKTDTWYTTPGSTIPVPSDPSRDGFAFDGWYSNAECTEAWDFSTTVSVATTLYAKWVNAWYFHSKADDKHYIMTRSSGHSYWYFACNKADGNNVFWAQSNGTDYGYEYNVPGYLCTSITNMNSSENTWSVDGVTKPSALNEKSYDYYVIVFPPNTIANSTSDPIICATASSLPEEFYSVESGHTIYFDNSVAEWTTPYIRLGRTCHVSSNAMTKVSGTNNLYKFVTSDYEGYQAFHIADNEGASGDKASIYTVRPGSNNISECLVYQKYNIDGDYTFTYDDVEDDEGDCDYYYTTKTSGMKTDRVTISDYSNGTITVNYTNTSGSAATLTSGSADLAHTVILTSITAVGNTGYDAGDITINGDDYSDNYVVTGATTIAASFTLHAYNVTYSAPTNGDYTIKVADGTASSASKTATMGQTITIAATPSNQGYYFTGWTILNTSTSADVTTTLLPSSSTTASTSFTMPTYDVTITANFAPRFGLEGSLMNDVAGGMPGWEHVNAANFEVISFTGLGASGVNLRCSRTLEPNKEYKFRVYDRQRQDRLGVATEDYLLETNSSVELSTVGDESGKNVLIYTEGYGTYIFHITQLSETNFYPTIEVIRQASSQLTLGWKHYTEGELRTGDTGGTVTAATNEGSGFDIANGQFFANSSTITFTASPATGYHVAGWYSDASCTSAYTSGSDGATISGEGNVTLSLSSVSSNKTVYAKFAEDTNTFSAASGSNWNTTANWSAGHVPTINEVVIIENPVIVNTTAAVAKRVIIYNDGDTKTGHLTLYAGAKLIVATKVTKTTNGSNEVATTAADLLTMSDGSNGIGALVWGTENHSPGAASVDFYTLSGNMSEESKYFNQLIGTPYTSATSNWHYNYYDSWVLGVDYTSTPRLVPLSGDDVMKPFEGYCIIYNGNVGHSYAMDGTLVTNGDVTLSLKKQGANSDLPIDGNENVLANSWLAPIKVGPLVSACSDASNVYAGVYIFEAANSDADAWGNYAVYTNTSESAVIPSLQSFSLFTTSGTGTVTLDYKDMVYDPAVAGTNPAINRAPRHTTEEANKLRVFVKAESGYGDMVYMWERSDFSEGYDKAWDGHKIAGDAEAPQLYAVTSDGNMAVNCVPEYEGTVLGFKAGTEDTQYTFSFEYDNAETLYLYDTQTEQETIINDENTYTFTTTDEVAHNRFVLSKSAKMPTSIDETNVNAKVVKFIEKDQLYILREGKLYNATGALVK